MAILALDRAWIVLLWLRTVYSFVNICLLVASTAAFHISFMAVSLPYGVLWIFSFMTSIYLLCTKNFDLFSFRHLSIYGGSFLVFGVNIFLAHLIITKFQLEFHILNLLLSTIYIGGISCFMEVFVAACFLYDKGISLCRKKKDSLDAALALTTVASSEAQTAAAADKGAALPGPSGADNDDGDHLEQLIFVDDGCGSVQASSTAGEGGDVCPGSAPDSLDGESDRECARPQTVLGGSGAPADATAGDRSAVVPPVDAPSDEPRRSFAFDGAARDGGGNCVVDVACYAVDAAAADDRATGGGPGRGGTGDGAGDGMSPSASEIGNSSGRGPATSDCHTDRTAMRSAVARSDTSSEGGSICSYYGTPSEGRSTGSRYDTPSEGRSTGSPYDTPSEGRSTVVDSDTDSDGRSTVDGDAVSCGLSFDAADGGGRRPLGDAAGWSATRSHAADEKGSSGVAHNKADGDQRRSTVIDFHEARDGWRCSVDSWGSICSGGEASDSAYYSTVCATPPPGTVEENLIRDDDEVAVVAEDAVGDGGQESTSDEEYEEHSGSVGGVAVRVRYPHHVPTPANGMAVSPERKITIIVPQQSTLRYSE